MTNPSSHALEAARSIANYCLTRFPCDAPPHSLFDAPWFSEYVQKAIDAVLASHAQHFEATAQRERELGHHERAEALHDAALRLRLEQP